MQEHKLPKITKLPTVFSPKGGDVAAEYLVQIPGLMGIKASLNAKKNSLDDVDAKKFSSIVEIVRGYQALLGRNGILCKDYGAEVASNAWTKLAEEYHKFIGPSIKKKQTEFNSLSLAEAPGNFLLALNHLLPPNIKWRWLANSFVGAKGDSEGYLEDRYGLMRKYKNQWLRGPDGDGDITSPDNLRSFQQITESEFGRGVHLLTSDVKYVQKGQYNEEERMNIPVHTGHVIAALTCVARGGMAILKHFTMLESASVALLHLLCYHYDEVWITKPETSRASNSEVYLVCTGFLGRTVDVEGLFEYLTHIRFMNSGQPVPAIFKTADFDDDLVSDLTLAQLELAKRQEEEITSNLSFYEKCRNDLRALAVERESMSKKICDAWLEKNKIPKLSSSRHMLRRWTQK
jgi:hypothetical protein